MRLIGLAVVLTLKLALMSCAAEGQQVHPKAIQAYRIGPEDVLLISVWKNEAMSLTIPVRPDGKISLPLLNDMQAAGLTTRELRDVLIERLKDFIPSPEVSVIVADVRSTKVGVDRTTVLMNVLAGGLGGGFMRPRPLMWDGILMPNGKPFPR